MKYKFLLISSVLSSAVMAQTSAPKLPSALEHAERTAVVEQPELVSHSWTTRALAEDLGVVLFSENFSAGVSSWTNTSLSSGNERWEYRGPSTTPSTSTGSRGAYAGSSGPINSTTKTNGFVIMDSDWWDNGGTVGGTGQQSSANHQAALTSPTIDCSLYPAVILTFESYLRNYQSYFYVIVSNDGFTTQDTVWNGADYYSVNTSSTNYELVKLNISASAGSQSAVQVRFLYSSNTAASLPGYYFWQLDDITVSSAPDNDLAVDEVWAHGWGNTLADYRFTQYYTQIPLRQAMADNITFGAAISNRGSADQPNTMVTATVSGGGAYSTTSSTSNLTTNSVDSLDCSGSYTADAIDTYTLTWEVSSDSTEDYPDDNTMEYDFDVTDYIYGWDDNALQSGVYWGSGSYGLYSLLDVYATDTVVGVEIAVYNSSSDANWQTTPGTVIEMGVWPVTSYNNGVPVLGTAIGNLFYTIQGGADQNAIFRAMFDEPKAIPSGTDQVVVGYKYQAGQLRTVVSQYSPAYGNVWVDSDNDGVLDGWTSRNPIIHMVTWSNDLCSGKTFVLDHDVTCDLTGFTAEVTPIVTTNPASASLSYNWSTGTSDETIVIDEEGDYSYTVTDENLCSETHSFTVTNGEFNCNLAVGDVANAEFGFGVVPNPNNGNFKIMFEGNASNVQMMVQSVKGEIVYQSSANVGNGSVINLNLANVATGVYLVKVVGETHTQIERIIIE